MQSTGVLGAVGLAGCLGGLTGGDDSDDSEEEVEEYGDVDEDAIVVDYWELFSGGDGEVMGNLVDEFNETHDEVQIQGQRVPWDEYYDRFFTSLSGGNPPVRSASSSSYSSSGTSRMIWRRPLASTGSLLCASTR
jgi:multiple sugar transport system substrate-binding protein